jgi:hypothetical protein
MNKFSFHRYNFLCWLEQLYYCSCLAQKTRDKAQQTVGTESTILINFPVRARNFYHAIKEMYWSQQNKQTHIQAENKDESCDKLAMAHGYRN